MTYRWVRIGQRAAMCYRGARGVAVDVRYRDDGAVILVRFPPVHEEGWTNPIPFSIEDVEYEPPTERIESRGP